MSVRLVKVLLRLLRINAWGVPTIVLLGILASLAEGIGISLFIPLLQNLDRAQVTAETGHWLVDSLNGAFQGTPPEDRLLIISLCILAAILLKSILSYANASLFSWLDAHVGHGLRSGIYKKLLTVDYPFLERGSSGRFLNTLSEETWRTGEALSAFVSMIILTCTLAVYAVILFLISWKMTLIIGVVMFLVSMILRFQTRGVERLGRVAVDASGRMEERMIESIEGMKQIRVFGREAHELDRFDGASGQVCRIQQQAGYLTAAVGPVYELLAGAVLLAILLFSVRTPEALPTVLIFVFVLYRTLPVLMSFNQESVKLGSLKASVDEVTSLLNETTKAQCSSGVLPATPLREAIQLDAVGFRYDDSEELVLRDVSVTIPRGETTAFVGPSGAGKSTLINLLLRLYDPSQGEIRVDGRPLRDLELSSWRERVALVSQDLYVFNTTVRENIAYGRPGASDEEIEEAARAAAAHQFITDLPDGYDTIVGDRGVRLSGGQQQRLSLARAIVRRADILLLDEATNALDSISESVIGAALDRLGGDCTVIVIAHRLATIERADQIIVLENGTVVDRGNFDQLRQRKGVFSQLYKLQHRAT